MRVGKARDLYLNKGGTGKMNCAQAIIGAFGDNFPVMPGGIEAFSGYGRGKAPGGECGAYHAARLILSKYDAGMVGKLEEAFSGKAGSTKCEEIRQTRKITCVGCVETAAEFIEGASGKNKAGGNTGHFSRISPKEAHSAASGNASVKLLDVRNPLEFGGTHIKGSVNIPLDMLKGSLEDLKRSGEDCVVVCRTGRRADIAAGMLVRSGMGSVKVLDGGIAGWQRCKLPVVKGSSGISLERQMRIAAGSMVVLGVALSWLTHWAFGIIAAFAGCGLVYAGVTDNCPMGMLLMKLPYNKKMYNIEPCHGACSADVV